MESKRVSLSGFVKSGAIFPAIWITCIAAAVIGVLSYIIGNAFHNHGLMPQPDSLARFDCAGFAVPLAIDFRHGKDAVQLHAPGLDVKGEIINGKIVWTGLDRATQSLGFAPPTEMVYDDPTSIRMRDANGAERSCSKAR